MNNIDHEETRPSSEQLDREIKRRERSREFIAAIRASISILLVFSACAVLLSTLMLPVFRIRQSSMMPTLKENEVVVFITSDDIYRGDIVAFRYENRDLIKRVIAVGGEWVNINADGVVIIDGASYPEPFVNEHILGECNIEFPYLVPDGKFFVLGDNRADSLDSRFIGAVDRELIVGKAFVRVWPLSRILIFRQPESFVS